MYWTSAIFYSFLAKEAPPPPTSPFTPSSPFSGTADGAARWPKHCIIWSTSENCISLGSKNVFVISFERQLTFFFIISRSYQHNIDGHDSYLWCHLFFYNLCLDNCMITEIMCDYVDTFFITHILQAQLYGHENEACLRLDFILFIYSQLYDTSLEIYDTCRYRCMVKKVIITFITYQIACHCRMCIEIIPRTTVQVRRTNEVLRP